MGIAITYRLTREIWLCTFFGCTSEVADQTTCTKKEDKAIISFGADCAYSYRNATEGFVRAARTTGAALARRAEGCTFSFATIEVDGL